MGPQDIRELCQVTETAAHNCRRLESTVANGSDNRIGGAADRTGDSREWQKALPARRPAVDRGDRAAGKRPTGKHFRAATCTRTCDRGGAKPHLPRLA